MPNGSLVYSKEAQSIVVEHPHGMWACLKQKAILLLCFPQLCCRAIPFQSHCMFGKHSLHNDRKTIKVVFQDIVIRAGLDAFNSEFISQRSSHEHERQVDTRLTKPANGIKAGPVRDAIVSQNQGIGMSLYLMFKFFGCTGYIAVDIESCFFQLVKIEAGVCRIVLKH